ncbi:NAD(P)-dependent alcohol dehydrogenase [Micromonospora sp. WMMD1155]|uniref:zinc-dependent alcohol dehydrogenase family protein n=1 Tax=Micromonospora sp. WMMD1155 TaxID=3016094 RepID=UPI00249CDB9E|nr:NAD(P)-dependent alcohol dehydrogenase [Micromonospora sp. WMMD1155]WFE48799.1 NAD(P)-dependent alcohol dehydrogenase [Micromonospora sp. WMMD1155]WFE54951.1 NAD(P)-dependent alcohol dehydrogenase [Micromonospora sp. WMMD1155]
MKAVVVQRPGTDKPLEVVELPDPGQPQFGEIRVRLHGSTLNFHDSLAIRSATTPVGHIPLADGAGVVEAVGPGVDELVTGDHVVASFFPFWNDGRPTVDTFSRTPGLGLAGYAREIVVAPAAQFVKAPRGYSHPEAATLTVAGLTAWRALVSDAAVTPGNQVLIMGTGGVAVFALQFAKMLGATAIVTSSSDAKLRRARQLGADHTVNYRSVPDWGRHVFDLTGGGVDVVVELGGAATLPQSIDAARIGGLISLIGILAGVSGDVPTGTLNLKQVRLHGLVVGSRTQQQQMIRAIDATGTRPIIDRTFALDDLAEATDYLSSGAHLGKVAITF